MLRNATPLRKSAPACSSNVPRLPSFLEMLQNPRVLAHFWQGAESLAARHATPHLNLQKWSEHVVPLTFWLWYVLRASSRHNGVHFFDIATSKSAPNLVCFVHFDYQMCFTPTTACTFSSRLPKMVRTWCALYTLSWKSASRHNCVHFFNIATSKSAPNLVCFVHSDLEMCFTPQLRALFHLNF